MWAWAQARQGSALADIFQQCSRAAVPIPTATNSMTFPVSPTPADVMLPQVVVTLVGMRGAVTASWAHLACFQWHVLRACLCAYQPSGCPSAMGPSTAFALVCFLIELSAFFLLIYKRSLYITAASPFQVRVVRMPSLTLDCLFTLLRVYWF